VLYDGLLWAANRHRGGLLSLSARLTQVSESLAIAEASAVFRDDTSWTESADATPANCNKRVAAHFPRMALTRAKARALRDALGIGSAAAEELGEEAAGAVTRRGETGELASEKQIEYLKSLYDQLGVTPAQVASKLRQKYGHDMALDQLTRKQASTLIEQLKNYKARTTDETGAGA